MVLLVLPGFASVLAKGKKMKVVTAEYDESGYVVFVDGEEVYSAGANPRDSQAPGRRPLRVVRRWATITADDIAEEVGGVVGEITKRVELVRREKTDDRT